MENIYEVKICNNCKKYKNENCNPNICIVEEKDLTTYKCLNYIKDVSRIMPYEKPLQITAKRNGISYVEI